MYYHVKTVHNYFVSSTASLGGLLSEGRTMSNFIGLDAFSGLRWNQCAIFISIICLQSQISVMLTIRVFQI